MVGCGTKLLRLALNFCDVMLKLPFGIVQLWFKRPSEIEPQGDFVLLQGAKHRTPIAWGAFVGDELTVEEKLGDVL